MNRDIRLYLGGESIEWSKVPDILLTYQRTDYLNPTITKNMFSKTITIEGTQKNNGIFNHIWKLDRIMDENFTLFNPSQRVEFELFNNAEIVEKGYAKLDSITKDGYKIAYNITLYGGLGSFFYNLAYDIDTDKERTLADLNYTNTSNPDNEFDFEINKNTIYDAWDRIGKPNNTGSWKKWDYINFVPCYNGLPEDFDSDRVLINVHDLNGMKVRYTNNNTVVNDNFPMYITNDGTSYSTSNGYLNGKMMRQCDEWEMRDLRSYLQRPCMSVKGLFDAICNPINNGGYNVVLDTDFFSSGNPYYSKAWITLPMMDTEIDSTDEYVDWDWYKAEQYNYSYSIYTGNMTHLKWRLGSVTPIVGTPDVFSMDVEIHTTITGTSADRLYMSSRYMTNWYDPELDETVYGYVNHLGCMTVQLYGFGDGNLSNASGKCGSNVICFTNKVGNEYISRSTIKTYYGLPYEEADIQYNFGYWKKVSGSDYVWHNETDDTDTVHLQMDSNLMSEIPNIGIGFGNLRIMDGPLVPAKCGFCFDADYYPTVTEMNAHQFKYWDKVSLENMESKIIYKVSGKMRSYQQINKKNLLGGMEGTPCDWLLSYCKLFGLFIEKDKVKNTIYIKLRNNWYKDETVDLEQLIDRSKEINVNPLTFESKWYNFKYEEAEGKFLNRYKDTYSQDFGKQLIDTKYNFDADEIDLLEDTKFRNGLTALEKSNYFNTKYDDNGKQIPQCLFNWCTVTYYNDADTMDTNMCLPQQHTTETLNPNTPNEFYDFLPKLQLRDEEKSPTDGDGILVFFNGIKNTGNADYWISDDVDEMFIDSETPCWLQTRHEWDVKWTERIAIKRNSLPEFSRYKVYNNMITAALDFGYTKELYVPYYGYDINRTPTMYENFWKSYIQDLYSVNTRNVDCYVALNSNDVYDFMKRFYWFDKCYWVCTKVTDFDIAIDKSTLCSFTKVNSKDAYLEMPTFDDKFFNFYHNGSTVPSQGTDEERSFEFILDCSSNWIVTNTGEGFASYYPNTPTSGTYIVGQVIRCKYEPNYSQSPRYCTYIADNTEGEMRMIRVWQDGYVKEKQLTLTPNSLVLPKTVLTATTVQVNSSANWFCNAGSWVVISPTYGNSGTTNISVSATTNSGEQRTLQVLFNNADGLSTTLNVQQKGMANVTLEQNEILPITTVAASGTGNSGVFYKLVNDIECTVEPLGNTANYAVASGQVTYSTTIQPQNGMNFWIKVDPNNSTVTRNIAFYANYVEDGGRYTVMPTIVPLPLVQEASGNTTVELSDKGQGVSTNLGASMPWTATTNNSWITILTPSGSSSDHSVQYTVAQNEGTYRVGHIYIAYLDEMGYYCNEDIIIKQEGVSGVVISPTAITVSDRGGDYYINIESPNDFTTQISENWVQKEMSRNGGFTIHIEQNDGYERNMNIAISTNGETHYIAIRQLSSYSDDYVLDYAPSDIVFDSSGGTITVTIRSDSDWEITQ